MAEVTANNFWFVVVALIFLPLTGELGVSRLVYLLVRVVNLKTQSIDFKLTDPFKYADFI